MGFFEEGWIYFYKVVLTIIKKSKSKIVNAENPDTLLSIDNVKVGTFGKLLMKVTTKKTSSNIAWGEVLNSAKKWTVNAEVVQDIADSFDEKTFEFTKEIDMQKLSDAFRAVK